MPDGTTGSTDFVTPPIGTTTVYSLTITDACGNTLTDNISINNPCLALPLDVTSFSGYNQNGINFIHWETMDETDFTFYILERSTDGMEFKSVIVTDGKGQAFNEYSITDDEQGEVITYYRLAQVEMDEVNFSEVIAITSEENNASVISIAGENPVHNGINLTINSLSAGEGFIIISDVTGKNILAEKIYTGKGMNAVYISLPSGISPGNYILFYNNIDGSYPLGFTKQ